MRIWIIQNLWRLTIMETQTIAQDQLAVSWLKSKKFATIAIFQKAFLSKSQTRPVNLGYDPSLKEFLAVKYLDRNRNIGKTNGVIQTLLDNSKLEDYLLLPRSVVSQSQGGKLYYEITKFCNRGDLGMYLQRSKNRLEYNHILQIVRMIMAGYRKLHSLKICHNDLKASNIFIHNDRVMIGDFDQASKTDSNAQVAKDLKQLQTIFREIAEYIRPDQILNQGFMEFSDQDKHYSSFGQLDLAFKTLYNEQKKKVKLQNFGFPFSQYLTTLMADIASNVQLPSQHTSHTSQINQAETNPALTKKIDTILRAYAIIDQLKTNQASNKVQQLRGFLLGKIVIQLEQSYLKHLDRDCPSEFRSFFEWAEKNFSEYREAFYEELNKTNNKYIQKCCQQISQQINKPNNKHKLNQWLETSQAIKSLLQGQAT